jgi:hypothetical protein
MPRPATRLARLSSLLLLLLLLLAPVATRCDDDDNVAAAETGATRDAAAGDHLGDVPVALDAEKTKIDVDAPTLKDANAELENIMASELGKAMRGKSMEERVGILGKLQSPEGRAMVKEHFNSEKFQDAIDKREAERGIARPGNPYNELARQRKAEKEGKVYDPTKKRKKKFGGKAMAKIKKAKKAKRAKNFLKNLGKESRAGGGGGGGGGDGEL